MLLRPEPENRLPGIAALLDAWNADADDFRRSALAARHGAAPSAALVAAAEDAHDALLELIDELDAALNRLSPGDPRFAGVLNVRGSALALSESIGNSYDQLERYVTDAGAIPRQIVRGYAIAAE